MATVHLPRSLVALFPSLPRRVEVDGSDVDEVLRGLETSTPGLRDRLVEPGPRIREHINIFVDGERATLATPVGPGSVVHVIPAVSGGASGARAAPG
jgi:molybdopterin synthase sulfur carrier subunit